MKAGEIPGNYWRGRSGLRWIWLGLFVILLPVGGVLVFRSMQHSMIYHPRPYRPAAIARLAPDGVELKFRTLAGSQSAFYLPQGSGLAQPPKVWVAFCGNGSLALDWLGLVRQTAPAAGAFLLVDYPGYGKSDGSASIAGTEAAADGALAALARHLRIDERDLEPRLCVLGHSLGAAAALQFTGHHSVQSVIAISPFTSLREEAAYVFGRPISFLLVENYDNRARLRDLALRKPRPRVAIFHGTDDSLIPVWMGRKLAQEFPDMVQFFPVAGGGHGTVLTLGEQEILEQLER